ncbi:SAM-dependent methyltransferase [Ideonella sp. A 288]|uniref:class I SAM-dependent methyltransferase n=1 Tax=Ideonella sp. A 288 TaxID=1962181 RepID=UPI000B4B3717|nr:SAM-dependent methyltransferase [Ideonella sp. A 288]
MPTAPDPLQTFADALAAALTDGSFVKAVLSRYHGTEAGLQRIDLRRVRLRDEPHLQWVLHHSTRDLTRNTPLADAAAQVRAQLGAEGFRSAHLDTRDGHAELTIGQRGTAHLRQRPRPAESSADVPAPVDEAHNREKRRPLSLDRPFLAELGVTTAQHALVPAMARKWKQINRFIEVIGSALDASRLATAPALHIVDFGCGKGYLTFAVHDWLRHARGVQAQVTGVELRPDMVSLCQGVIDRLGLQGLRIEQGDVRSWHPRDVNVVIALHACDMATDHAIDLGIRGGADIIVCSPCCHKQIRPQLLSPHPLRPILQHGVHLGQEAEMLTDGLRAMLLEAMGYDTQVFEFISLEHTNKNKMILAVKRAQPNSAQPVLAQIAEVKAFYGIREQCLETLLQDRLARLPEPVADNPA